VEEDDILQVQGLNIREVWRHCQLLDVNNLKVNDVYAVSMFAAAPQLDGAGWRHNIGMEVTPRGAIERGVIERGNRTRGNRTGGGMLSLAL